MGHPVPPPDGWVKGNDCVNCPPGQTPKFITVKLWGLSVCGGCYTVGVKSLEFFGAGNGTFLLTQHPDHPCLWEYTKPEALPRDVFNDPFCEDFIVTVHEWLYVDALRYANSVSILAHAGGYAPAKMIFKAENIGVSQCMNSLIGNNTCTCVAHHDRSAGGFGQSAEGVAS